MRLILRILSCALLCFAAQADAQAPYLYPGPLIPLGGYTPSGFHGGMLGGLVADLNQDGIGDLAGLMTSTDAVSVALSSGGASSLPVVILPTFNSPVVAVAVDLDLDVDLDLVVSCYGTTASGSQLMVFLNDGAGAFAPPLNQILPDYVTRIQVGDINVDGFPDLFIADSSTFAAVLLGMGNGTFAAPTLVTGLPWGSIQLADDDMDGDPDLHVHDGSTLTTRRNDGFGNFQTAVASAVFVGSGNSKFDDVDGDGDLDAIAAVYTATNQGNVQVAFGNGGGSFTVGPVMPVAPFDISYFITADVNGDGNPEILALKGANTSNGLLAEIRNDGSGGFLPAELHDVNMDPGAMSTGDMTGNGYDDLVIFGGLYNAELHQSAGPEGLRSAFRVPTGGTDGKVLRMADLKVDGRLDAIAAHGTGVNGALSVLLHLRTGPTPLVLPMGATVEDVALGDWNRDGYRDLLVVRGFPIHDLVLYPGDGLGGFAASTVIGSLSFPRQVKGADVNGDGNLDAVVLDSQVSVLLGDGAGGFGAPIQTTVCSGPLCLGNQNIGVGDLNQDGVLDLAVTHFGYAFTPSSMDLFLGNGTGTFTFLSNHSASAAAPIIIDLNRDGIADIVQGLNELSWWIGQGGGSFGSKNQLGIPGPYIGSIHGGTMAIGDVNGDGFPDAVFDGGTTFVNDGTGQFVLREVYTIRHANAVAVEDVDRDGQQDIVVLDSGSGELAILYNLTSCAGLIAPYGIGCPGTGGFVPELTAFGCPEPGGTTTIELGGALGGAQAWLLVGQMPVNIPVGSGCTLYVDLLGSLFLPLPLAGTPVAGAGSASLSITLPPATPPGITGAVQAIVLDPAAPLTVSGSNGLLFVFQ